MDNRIDLEFEDETESNKKAVLLQQCTDSNELESNNLPEAWLNNNHSTENSNDCEGNEKVMEKINPISNVLGFIGENNKSDQEIKGFKTNQSSPPQTGEEAIGNDKVSVLNTQQNFDENSTMDDIDIDASTGVSHHNCVENGSASIKAVPNFSLPPCNEIAMADTDKSESAQRTVLNSIFGKSSINPTPNNFDMVQGKDSSCHGLLLNNENNDLVSLESDKSVVISNNNAIPQAESIVTSNFSLRLLESYDSDVSSDGEACEINLHYRERKNQAENSDKDSESDSSSSSSSTSIIISSSSDSESDELYENFTMKPSKPIKGRKELDLEDLPPIEDLKITVPEEDCIPIGKVFQIVDCLVVVQAFKDIPTFNLDTILFLEGGQPLGKVFDVFGPVNEPYYCVRFNSRDHLKEKNICINQVVYSAPKYKTYTNYVFVGQLMKLKGSDASWEDDLEPPEMYLEYSDDEQEQRAKKKKSKNRNRKAVPRVDADPDEPARKKHFAYEKKMNERNLRLNAERKNQIGNRSTVQESNRFSFPATAPSGPSSSNPVGPSHRDVSNQMFGRPPIFQCRVPPNNAQLLFPPQLAIPRHDEHLHTPNSFSNANNSYSSEQSPDNGSNNSPGFNYFLPTHLQAPYNNPRWNSNTPPFPGCDNPWRNSHFNSRDESVINNPFPSSPVWTPRQPPPSSSVMITPFSALPNRQYVPRGLSPPPFWRTHTPQPRNDVSSINTPPRNSSANFSQHPSTNRFSYY